MSKAKFEAANELIRERRYDEARSILKTINHPKAAEWLQKLDSIAPQSTPSKSKSGCMGALRSIVLAVILFFGCYSLFLSSNKPPNVISTTSNSTLTPMEHFAKEVIERTFSVEQIEVYVGDDEVTISMSASELPSPRSAARTTLNSNIVEMICNLRNSGFRTQKFEIDITHGLSKTGLENTYMPNIVLIITVENETSRNFNCNDPSSENLESKADEYIWAPD